MRRLGRWSSAGLLGALLAGGLLVAPLAGSALADDSPGSDPNAVGSITLCANDGQPITSGSVNDRPIAWRVVGSSAAPAPYDGAGRTATLFGFQPRAQIPAGQWSGELLTASSRYTNPAHPMVAATVRDSSVGDFLGDFPAQQGVVQLRIFLGVPNQPTYNQKYNAALLKIDGDTWTALNPRNASCTSGTSASIEDLLPQPSTPAAATTTKPSAKPTAASKPSTGAPSQAAAGSPSAVAAADAAAVTDGSSNHSGVVLIVVLALVALLGGGWLIARLNRT